MALVKSQYEDSVADLEAEKKKRIKAEEEVKRMDMEVHDTWSQLESTVGHLNQGQKEIDRLKDEMESVKRQYYLVSDKVEEEQGRLMEAQRLTATLSDQVIVTFGSLGDQQVNRSLS